MIDWWVRRSAQALVSPLATPFRPRRALKWHNERGTAGLQGKAIWKAALDAGYFPGRTVDSLQTHFRADAKKGVYHRAGLVMASATTPTLQRSCPPAPLFHPCIQPARVVQGSITSSDIASQDRA